VASRLRVLVWTEGTLPSLPEGHPNLLGHAIWEWRRFSGAANWRGAGSLQVVQSTPSPRILAEGTRLLTGLNASLYDLVAGSALTQECNAIAKEAAWAAQIGALGKLGGMMDDMHKRMNEWVSSWGLEDESPVRDSHRLVLGDTPTCVMCASPRSKFTCKHCGACAICIGSRKCSAARECVHIKPCGSKCRARCWARSTRELCWHHRDEQGISPAPLQAIAVAVSIA
jgi:hypothetical protein